MNYKQLVDYMKLQKYTDDQIKRTIIFLDNQEYYETTKKLNQEIIEEVQKTNEIITENVLEFKKEEVVKIQKEELQETLSNIILDLKPEELKIKFLESNIDRANAYDNIDFLMKVIPETSTKYEALKDVKSELELKPISTISSKQPQDYTLSSYNKELNIDLSKPKENIDINFSKPTQKFDTSSLEPKTITPIDYSSVEVKSKNYLNSYQQNDIPLDLSKPKMVNVEYPKQETIIPTKVEVKSNDIPTTPKILNNDEKFGEYIERTFSNIENKKYTLSGLDELVKDLNTYKEKETNPQKKEIFEVLETSAFSQFVVSVDQYNKDFNKEVTEQIKTKINQNEKEINVQEDIKRYEEEHKNDSKVKESSIFSFTLLGALLDNLNATYITQEEYQEKQKQHSKMLQEKDLDTQKYEEKLELKKEEEKDKNYKSLGYFSAVSTLMYYKNLELNVINSNLNNLQSNIFNKLNDDNFTKEEQDFLNIGQLNLVTAGLGKFVDILSGKDKQDFKNILDDFKKIDLSEHNSSNKAHKTSGDILIALNEKELLNKLVKTPEGQNLYNSIIQIRTTTTAIEIKNQIKELTDKEYRTKEEEEKLEQLKINWNNIRAKNEELSNLNEKLKKINEPPLSIDYEYQMNKITNEYNNLFSEVEKNEKMKGVINTTENSLQQLNDVYVDKLNKNFVKGEEESSNLISKEKSSIFSKKDSNDSFVHSFEDM